MQNLRNTLLAVVLGTLIASGLFVALNSVVPRAKPAMMPEASAQSIRAAIRLEKFNEQLASFRADPYLRDMFNSRQYDTSSAVAAYSWRGDSAFRAYGQWTEHDLSAALPYIRSIQSADANADLWEPWGKSGASLAAYGKQIGSYETVQRGRAQMQSSLEASIRALQARVRGIRESGNAPHAQPVLNWLAAGLQSAQLPY